jgi:hypothetical protein
MDFLLLFFTITIGFLIAYIIGQRAKQQQSNNKRPTNDNINNPAVNSSDNNNITQQQPANIPTITMTNHLPKPTESPVTDPLDDSDSDEESSGQSFLMSKGVKGSDSASTERHRIVIVAKTLPVRTIKDPVTGAWRVEWDDSRNFLSGMNILRNSMDVKWVGSPNTNVEISRDEQDDYEEMMFAHDCIPVFLPSKLSDRFFNGFCKQILWPMLHYVMPQSNESFGAIWDDLW